MTKPRNTVTGTFTQTHFLEEWADGRAYDGTISITQPIIKPLYGGKSIYEVVQVFFKENYDKPNADILKEYWQKTSLTNAPKTVAATASTSATPQTSPSSTHSGSKRFAESVRFADSECSSANDGKPECSRRPPQNSPATNAAQQLQRAENI